MIKLHKHTVYESYLHACEACGRNLAKDAYETMYVIDLDKVNVKLCKKCKNTLARKLTNFI